MVFLLVVIFTACTINAEIETPEVQTPVVSITQTSTPAITSTPSPTLFVGIRKNVIATPTFTPTVEPTVVPTSISLEGMYSVSIQSEFLSDWYLQFFKNLEISWCEEPCSVEKIEVQLEFGGEVWMAVQDGRVFYIHSGWHLLKGPELGELLLRINNSGSLDETILCLDDSCFEVIGIKILNKEEAKEIISLGEIFNVQQGDYFIFTCATRMLPGVFTPKLLIQIRLLN